MTGPPILISIIMPVKNALPFLDACLTSILVQTYVHWELIACNDNSSDLSEKTLHKYAEADSRIKLIQNEGKGITPALQSAYKIATGSYITRMDADDIMPASKLEKLLHALKNKPHLTVATGYVKYFSDSILGEGYKNYETWLNKLIDQNTHWDNIFKECVIPSPCWLISKTAFDQIGGFNATCYPEDYDLVWRMYMADIEVVGVQEVLHNWRDHQGRSSRNIAVYLQQHYFELKIKYLLQIEGVASKQIVVWGAGKKGKALVQLLIKKGIKPIWICNNTNKIGKEIYGITLENISAVLLSDLKNKIYLIAVSKTAEKQEITNILVSYGCLATKDFIHLL